MRGFYDRDLDGLAQGWVGACWINPPYGDAIADWVAKAHRSAREFADVVVCLLPARVDTAWSLFTSVPILLMSRGWRPEPRRLRKP